MQLIIVRQIKSIEAQRITVASINYLLFSTGSTVLTSYSGVFRSTDVAMLIQPPFQLFKVAVTDSFRINLNKAQASSVKICIVVRCCVEEEKFFLCHNKLFGLNVQVSLRYT